VSARPAVEALPEPAEKARVVEEMFDRIAPRYDRMNRVLTFRLDVGWRKRAVASLDLRPGAPVLDLACGTGDLTKVLRAAGAEPVGIDFSLGMLRADHAGEAKVRGDALQLPFPDAAFAAATCGFALRNFVALEPVLTELARVVQPGARIALLEVAEPANPIMRWGHGLWFRRAVPFLGGLFADRAAYRYLPASASYLPPTPELLHMLGQSGFGALSVERLGFGAVQLITGARR
jgi:demethylmenaquinone methyltransferase / 2-methoxy-6-polyprenyl-1,4-benzoquinol methylase